MLMSEHDELDRRVSNLMAINYDVDGAWHTDTAPRAAHDAWNAWQEALACLFHLLRCPDPDRKSEIAF
jgi:hypothetical protein